MNMYSLLQYTTAVYMYYLYSCIYAIHISTKFSMYSTAALQVVYNQPDVRLLVAALQRNAISAPLPTPLST
jgi:hypothetical protein